MAPTTAPADSELFLRESATTQSLLASALGVGEPWISRQVNGHARGPTAKFYDTLQALAEKAAKVGPRVNPGALVVGAIVVLRRTMAGFQGGDLLRLVKEGMVRETEAEAAENIAEFELARALGPLTRPNPTSRELDDARDAMHSYRSALLRECSVQVSLLLAVDAQLHALEVEA